MRVEVITAAVLITAQLAVFRASQIALPSLYFTTTALFERRKDVGAPAILFRLSIPFAAGIAAGAILTDNQETVGLVSGLVTWILIVWPVLWVPGLLPAERRGLLLLLYAGFLAGFAILGAVGAEIGELIREGESSDVAGLLRDSAVGVVSTFAVGVLGWVARTRLSFADDPDPEWTDPEEDFGYSDERTLGERADELITRVAPVASLLSLVLALYLFVRKRRAPP